MSTETRNFSGYRIVEIGPFDKPMLFCSQEVMVKFSLGANYIAMDPYPSHLARFAGRDPNLLFLEGELPDLPLKDGVAHEMWVFNVFGEGTLREDDAKRNDQGVIVQLVGRNHDYLSELARVVRPGGVVYIGETSGTSATWLKDVDMDNYGLEKIVYWGKVAVLEFFSQHGIRNDFSLYPIVHPMIYGKDSLILELRNSFSLITST